MFCTAVPTALKTDWNVRLAFPLVFVCEMPSPLKPYIRNLAILMVVTADLTMGPPILCESVAGISQDKIEDLGYDLNMDIDNFMIAEAKKIFDLPTYEIQDRWYGIYSQCKTQDIFLKDIDARIHVATGIGGKGMTGSAGFAKHHLEIILN